MDSTKEKLQRNKNPKESANLVSRLVFWWVLPIFWKGYKRTLTADDLFLPLKEHSSDFTGSILEREWDKELKNSQRKKKAPSFLWVLVKVFGPTLAGLGCISFVQEIVIRVSQPLLLGALIRYFSQLGEEARVDKNDAYLYAGGVIACSAVYSFVVHPTMAVFLHTGMKMRVATCSLIYRKALQYNKTELEKSSGGQMINLMSNDVNRFDICLIHLHTLWIGPIQTLIVAYLIWTQMGLATLVGIATLLVLIPLQGWLGKKSSTIRLRTAKRTDERVRLMNEIISGIQVIKMYTWEKPFAALVDTARRKEMKEISKSLQIKGINLSFMIYHARTAIFMTIMTYVLLGYSITAEKVFVLTSLYNIMRQTMTIFFPNGIAQAAEAMVSVKRIQTFLTMDLNSKTSSSKKTPTFKSKGDVELRNGLKEGELLSEGGDTGAPQTGIVLEKVTAKWADNVQENTLTDVSFTALSGQLTTIIGPVGSGKTSVLHTILKELPVSSGSVKVNGRLSYASQEPWLFHGSVRQNILFGEEFNSVKYREVVRVCCLRPDFEQFPYGDRTIVGERGVSLSGGQRARINLARAVYRDADIYLLDDPLSAVDTHVGKHLFVDCIQGYLKNKVVILITHQLQYLNSVPQIILLENGVIKSKGSYDTIQKSGFDFASSLVEAEEEEGLPLDNGDVGTLKRSLSKRSGDFKEKPIFNRLSSQVSIRSSSSLFLDETSLPVPLENTENQIKGSISGRVYAAYLASGRGCCYATLVLFLFILSQALASSGDYWISYWVNIEEYMRRLEHWNSINATAGNTTDGGALQNDTLVAPPSSPFLFFLSRDDCIYIFGGLTLATIFATMIRAYLFFDMSVRSSIKLHNTMFKSITRASMWFFNNTSSGQVLNRFSKDMGLIDELLPQSLMDVIQISLTCIAIVTVVLSVNPLLAVPTFAVAVIFYVMRKFYIATSRSVKRVESIVRSPVFAHVNASVQGLVTIKAFQAEKILIKEFDNHQDLHSSAWFLFFNSTRAFGFWLDMVCIAYIAMVTLSFLVLGGEYFGGNVGLAISQSIGLTGMFQWGMRQSAELENNMTAVERVLEYSELESEPPLQSPPGKGPRKTWPEKGEIVFSDVYLRYGPTEPFVLKELTFTVKPQKKIGIVGRTGAGKSSIIQALFRLAEVDGSIRIDSVDTGKIGLHELRSKISIIPQEPVLFSGTIRKNLDPFDEYSDDVLWSAIEQVELKEVVKDMVGGLQALISDGGSNLSVGQRQLVCLARAIVRNNRILVLDEATANVDPQTDSFIQETIRTKFLECTVLTIAHRLNTIMDSDKILVMDAGTMAEFEHPHILLQNENSIFTGMVRQTGPSMEEVLRRVAREVVRLSKKWRWLVEKRAHHRRMPIEEDVF